MFITHRGLVEFRQSNASYRMFLISIDVYTVEKVLINIGGCYAIALYCFCIFIVYICLKIAITDRLVSLFYTVVFCLTW